MDSRPSENGPGSSGDTGPLHGITVIDFTTFLSGPYCTQILADLGARVIKVEPLTGDSSRAIPPYFVDGDSAYYLGNNRNKESVALDLKTPDGQRLARQLVAAGDVVVENYRPGVARRLGIDPAELREGRPELVWASISGFGQDGPWRDRPAYDMIVQALSGVMSLTGEAGSSAMRLGIPAGDLVAGLFAAIGVLSAVIEQRGTGRGRHVDISMLDGQLSMLSYQAVYAMISGLAPQPQAARHDSIPTYRSFTAGDGRELVVTANTERMWRGLCTVLGVDELISDERFIDGGARLRHRDELWELLEAEFARDSAQAWVGRLVEHGVPTALIKTVPEAIDDAGHAGRDMVVELESDSGEQVRVVGNPVRFTDGGHIPLRYPPRLGQDGPGVLRELLGLDEHEIGRLRADGVLGVQEADR
ncbi:CaiB/BaiF CoA transferase family protein [Actinoalloteichus fjordicus]|uniref:CaiB/BaiF CoA transferase family protein n=1 Tax=Actinoalloteichus fjordicus TaxID=1612552 RepID=UPI000952A0AE|nr:CoA transferase [Actinoalloteichus fjordicus]